MPGKVDRCLYVTFHGGTVQNNHVVQNRDEKKKYINSQAWATDEDY